MLAKGFNWPLIFIIFLQNQKQSRSSVYMPRLDRQIYVTLIKNRLNKTLSITSMMCR